MIKQPSNVTHLWEYVVFLDERISRACKQGKDTTQLEDSRSRVMDTITTLKQPTPTINSPELSP